jgi:hypothetical protein
VLAEPIVQFVATVDNTFLYAVAENSALAVKEYFPQTNESDTLFRTPFREATILFGDSSADIHYFLPRPTRGLEGYLYSFAPATGIGRVPAGGFGFSAVVGDTVVLHTAVANK